MSFHKSDPLTFHRSYIDHSWSLPTLQMKIHTGNRPILSMMLYSGERACMILALHYSNAWDSSWDTFRTVHPLLSLTSPTEWAEIVNAYVDGWRNTGT